MNSRKVLALAVGSLVALALQQQAGAQQGSMGQGMVGQPGDAMVEGVVRKVDKDAGKLTIKHGPIPSMDMPPMTMVYRVKDPAMLDRVKPGDNVTFAMEQIGGQFTVTRLGAGK
ncbi:MAG: copper-binding protein [Betaproteobacteria bacterium]|nr:copper-binding protein [Betaproteobacteria bacterium]